MIATSKKLRHGPELLRTWTGTPGQNSRYDALRTRLGEHLPWTLTYGAATIDEIATALAALTGEPHPLAA